METTGTCRLPLGAMPRIRTARLELRAPAAQDAASIARLADDWDVARRMSRLPHPYTLDDALFFLRAIVPNEMAWALTSRGDGRLIGIAGLAPGAVPGQVELGYWLGRSYWMRGFATEAAEAIVAYAFDDLGLPALASGCFADNDASRRVLTKIGFAEVGRGERACLALGGRRRFIEMRLERTDRGASRRI